MESPWIWKAQLSTWNLICKVGTREQSLFHRELWKYDSVHQPVYFSFLPSLPKRQKFWGIRLRERTIVLKALRGSGLRSSGMLLCLNPQVGLSTLHQRAFNICYPEPTGQRLFVPAKLASFLVMSSRLNSRISRFPPLVEGRIGTSSAQILDLKAEPAGNCNGLRRPRDGRVRREHRWMCLHRK